jgi:hypothetical protein
LSQPSVGRVEKVLRFSIYTGWPSTWTTDQDMARLSLF